MQQRILAPSILSADFGHLADAVAMLNRSDAQWIHVDVMDGVFVPNISFGFPVMKPLRQATVKPLDVHLMIVEPERYLRRFAEAGADWLTFHLEATQNVTECIRIIRESGIRAGISIRPATSAEALRPWLSEVDLVLVMSVEPGFGGQKFMPESLDKVRALRTMAAECNPSLIIEVDGGVSSANARWLYDAGADAVVAGNAVFSAVDPEAEIRHILEA